MRYILNASFGVRCNWDHLDEKGMDDVGLFLCGPGQLGEGGGVDAFTHCIH